MAFQLRFMGKFLIFASLGVTVFGAKIVIKVFGWIKRLKNWASKSLAGQSVSSVLKLPGVQESTPPVQVQMICNWIKEFSVEHMSTQSRRIERSMKKLDAFYKVSRKMKLQTDFEIMKLAKLKRKLLARGIGVVSVATQVPKPKPKPPIVKLPPPRKILHVRFLLPPSESITPEESLHELVIPKRKEYIRMVFTYVYLKVKPFIEFFGHPILLSAIVTKISRWSKKLLTVDIKADLALNTTTMTFNVLPLSRRA